RCDQWLAPKTHRGGRRRGSLRRQQASQNAPPDGGHDEENGQRRPHAADAGNGRNAPWITARNVSAALKLKEGKTHGTSYSFGARRHQETPALQCGDFGFALSA